MIEGPERGEPQNPIIKKLISEAADELARSPWLGWDEIEVTEKDMDEMRKFLAGNPPPSAPTQP